MASVVGKGGVVVAHAPAQSHLNRLAGWIVVVVHRRSHVAVLRNGGAAQQQGYEKTVSSAPRHLLFGTLVKYRSHLRQNKVLKAFRQLQILRGVDAYHHYCGMHVVGGAGMF